MYSLNVRLTIGGCILIVLGAILIYAKGYSLLFAGLMIVGAVLAVGGLLMKPKDKPKSSEALK